MVTTRFWSGVTHTALHFASSAALLAQASWSQPQTQGPAPARIYHGAAYDFLRERQVTFGGFDSSFTVQASTWEFDGVNWSQASPAVSPPGRGNHAMIYHTGTNRVMLFGGSPSIFGSGAFNDLWEFDGATWTQVQTQTRPPARFDHAMAFDLVWGKIVLFGGRSGGFNQTGLGDTWEFDGTDWTLVAQNGPSPRFRHAMAFDLARGNTVLFGGRNVQHYADTWTWDGTSWTQHYPVHTPPIRAGHEIAYDIARAVCVMHGGQPLDSRTWEWDGTDWRQGGAMLYGRTDHTLVYDARLQRIVMHGGSDVQPGWFHPDVDVYSAPVVGSFTAQGTGCPGSTSAPTLSSPTSLLGPMIGTTSTIRVTGAPGHTFFAFGWSNSVDGSTILPYDLAAYGMPGCSLQVSRDYIASRFPVNGTTTIGVAIPNDPFLTNTRFYVQAFVLDLAANAGGFATTNHLAASVGRP